MGMSVIASLGFQLEDWRIRTHLKHVEQFLRKRDIRHLSPTLQAARRSNLDHLHTYWMNGIFPRNVGRRYVYVPCFIDEQNRTCAVAELMVQSGNTALAQRIDQMYHYARVRHMDAPELGAWVDQSGLTVDELALIQPGYGPVGALLFLGIIFGPILFVLSLVNVLLHTQNLRYAKPLRKKWLVSIYAVGGLLAAASVFLAMGILIFMILTDTGSALSSQNSRLIVLLVVLPVVAFASYVNYRGWLSSVRALRTLTRRGVLGGLAIALLVMLGAGLLVTVLMRRASPQTSPGSSLLPIHIATSDSSTVTEMAAVKRNEQWTPRIVTINQVEMVLVPPGCFTKSIFNGVTNIQPPNKMCFDRGFWLDKTPVTQAQFRLFEGKAEQPPKYQGDQRPVETVNWFEASAFCKLRGARLPTEAEWDYAAIGPDDLYYPWGNEWDPAKVVAKRSDVAGTADVGSIPNGASWVGALDMSGNVYQWVSTLYKKGAYYPDDGRENSDDITGLRVRRGAPFSATDSNEMVSMNRAGIPPNWRQPELGFRCAHS